MGTNQAAICSMPTSFTSYDYNNECNNSNDVTAFHIN